MFKFNPENHTGPESIYHDGANYWRENVSNVKVGDIVEFKGQDSYYKGTVISIFTKLDGVSVRCCVQDDRGLILIKNPSSAILLYSC